MLISKHIVISGIFVLLFSILVNLPILISLVIFLSSVLIDFDHYLFFVWRKRDISLRNAYKYYIEAPKGKEGKPGMMIFHTAEFFIFVLFLSFANTLFLFVLMGMVIHIIIDIFGMILDEDQRIFSFTLYMIRSLVHPERYK